MKPSFSKETAISKNFIAGIVGCFFSVFAMFYNKKPSSNYPAIVFWLMFLFGTLIFLESIFLGKNEKFFGFNWQELILMMMLVINPALGKYFGFYFTAFVEILAITIFVNKDKSKKGILVSVLFSIALIAVSYLIFTYGLRIRCPKGKIISVFWLRQKEFLYV